MNARNGPAADPETIRQDILSAFLPDVVFDGWAWEGVVKTSHSLGHDLASLHALFPDRLRDVLDTFSSMADQGMEDAVGALPLSSMRVRDRVRECVLARLEWLAPYKEAERAALCFWALPHRKPRAAKILWRTADRIWTIAGDTATDYNRYTKRILLSGVLATSTLAWLDDDSEDMEITRGFVDRRIENVMQLGKMISFFKARA